MKDPISWVGIDDHKEFLMAAVLGEEKEPVISKVPNEDRALARWVRRLVRDADGGEVRLCYEAGPNGFSLKRRLESMGPVREKPTRPPDHRVLEGGLGDHGDLVALAG
jgi:hypothetical protein